MAAAKDSCGKGEMATGNGRRLHLGIPEAVFVEDVDSFMKQPGNETADTVLKKLDEQYQKYKFMELNLAQKKRRLKGQIPEIKQTLEILKYMQKKKSPPTQWRPDSYWQITCIAKLQFLLLIKCVCGWGLM